MTPRTFAREERASSKEPVGALRAPPPSLSAMTQQLRARKNAGSWVNWKTKCIPGSAPTPIENNQAPRCFDGGRVALSGGGMHTGGGGSGGRDQIWRGSRRARLPKHPRVKHNAQAICTHRFIYLKTFGAGVRFCYTAGVRVLQADGVQSGAIVAFALSPLNCR